MDAETATDDRAARCCEECGAPLVGGRSSRRFCDWRCSVGSRAAARPPRLCPACGSDFHSVDPRQKFCSVRCARSGPGPNTGERAWNWRGGRALHGGYVMVRAPGHPRAASRRYVFEHIVVMEQLLGRVLLPNEHVHHKNGRRDDNRPENLELWRTKEPPSVRASDYHCFGCRCGEPPESAADGGETALPTNAASSEGSHTEITGRPPSAVVSSTECAWCGKDLPPNKVGQRCCSRRCARLYESVYYFRGKGRGWKGGRVRHSNGYVWVWAPDPSSRPDHPVRVRAHPRDGAVAGQAPRAA